MSATQQEHDKRALIGYTIGCIIALSLIIFLISYAANRKVLTCSYDLDLDDQTNEEMSVRFVWNYGKLTSGKTKVYYKTDEKITDEQIAEFKQAFENTGLYENIEYGDFFSYQVKAEADFKLDKVAEAFGGDDYDTVKSTFENQYLMTCDD